MNEFYRNWNFYFWLMEAHIVQISYSKKFVVLKKAAVFLLSLKKYFLTSESIEESSLSFQSIDDILGSDGLPLVIFSVSDRITDDFFQENLGFLYSFFIDQSTVGQKIKNIPGQKNSWNQINQINQFHFLQF